MSRNAVAVAISLILMSGGVAAAQGNSANAPGQDRVCLVTFNQPNTTANVDVTSAKILPRKAAKAQESDTARIFEYGAGGELTEAACACLDNPDTRATCNQPVKG